MIDDDDDDDVFDDDGTWYPQACRFLKLRIIILTHIITKKVSL